MLEAAAIAADAAAALEAVADATLMWTPSWGVAAVSTPVIYDAESVDGLGVVSAGHAVRYMTSALPDLREGEVVTIGAQAFRVAAPPRQVGDGRHSVAVLHRYSIG